LQVLSHAVSVLQQVKGIPAGLGREVVIAATVVSVEVTVVSIADSVGVGVKVGEGARSNSEQNPERIDVASTISEIEAEFVQDWSARDEAMTMAVEKLLLVQTQYQFWQFNSFWTFAQVVQFVPRIFRTQGAWVEYDGHCSMFVI